MPSRQSLRRSYACLIVLESFAALRAQLPQRLRLTSEVHFPSTDTQRSKRLPSELVE